MAGLTMWSCSKQRFHLSVLSLTITMKTMQTVMTMKTMMIPTIPVTTVMIMVTIDDYSLYIVVIATD